MDFSTVVERLLTFKKTHCVGEFSPVVERLIIVEKIPVLGIFWRPLALKKNVEIFVDTKISKQNVRIFKKSPKNTCDNKIFRKVDFPDCNCQNGWNITKNDDFLSSNARECV